MEVYGGPQPCESPETQDRAGPEAKAAGGALQSLTVSDGFDFNGLGDPLLSSWLYRFPADLGFEEGVD